MTPDERLDGFGKRLVGILNDALLDTDEMIEALYELAREMRWVANTVVPEQPTLAVGHVTVNVPAESLKCVTAGCSGAMHFETVEIETRQFVYQCDVCHKRLRGKWDIILALAQTDRAAEHTED